MAVFEWDTDIDTFQVGLVYLTAYAGTNGHRDVPLGYVTDDGFELGAWTARRRTQREAGTLTIENEATLDALDGWVWDAAEALFQAGMTHMRVYMGIHGNYRVPPRYVAPDGFGLGQWVARRRAAKKKGTLSAEHEAALNALGRPA